MNKADIFDSMSGVNESFLEESGNAAAVKKEFNKSKKRRILAVVASCCSVALCVGLVGVIGAYVGEMKSAEYDANYCVSNTSSALASVSDYEYSYGSAPAEPATTPASYAQKEDESYVTLSAVEKSSEKLVYNCRIGLETLEYDKTVSDIRATLKSFSGFVESENETNSDRYWYYTDGSEGSGRMSISMVLRVPSEHYEEFLAAVEGSGHVTSKNADVQNISRSYNDMQVLISALEQQEARLLEMMAQAETIEDMITVEKRLTEVQTELNQYRTDLSAMDTDVDLATVSLEISEVRELTETPAVTSTFGTRLKNAFKKSWRAFSSGMEGFLFALIYIIPFAAVIAVIAVIVILIVKKKRKKKAK